MESCSGLALATLFTAAQPFHSQQRRALIDARRKLPPAMRVPTELSLWWHIKLTFAVEEHLRAALAYQAENPELMRAIADSMVRQLSDLYPQRNHRRMIRRIARAVFVGRDSRDFYGLHRVAQRTRRMDYDECCARRATRHAS